MRIGIPGEIRQGETRAAATPETVRRLTQGGRHVVLVESGAGLGASILDSDFEAAGATLGSAHADIYAQSDVVLKVRGPEPTERTAGSAGS
jgi:NAD(P) transhydrogenase subunit alpha